LASSGRRDDRRRFRARCPVPAELRTRLPFLPRARRALPLVPGSFARGICWAAGARGSSARGGLCDRGRQDTHFRTRRFPGRTARRWQPRGCRGRGSFLEIPPRKVCQARGVCYNGRLSPYGRRPAAKVRSGCSGLDVATLMCRNGHFAADMTVQA